MRKLMVSLAVSTLLFAACGGGDDFSAPNPQDSDKSGDGNDQVPANGGDDAHRMARSRPRSSMRTHISGSPAKGAPDRMTSLSSWTSRL